jgi:prepilin-type N-terminal cleavage/methylation domain-containing protein
MRRFVYFLAIAVMLIVQSPVWASKLAFVFTGAVFNSISDPFGHPIPVSTAVTGRFVYDTESLPTQDLGNCDCAGYRQQIINGFSANFGDVAVRVDEYVVLVYNRTPGSGKDIFAVRFTSDFVPPLTSPIIVEGAAYATGLIDITLNDADGSLFSDPSLPNHLTITDFPSRVGRLRDTATGATDVVYMVNSLQVRELGDYDSDGQIDESDYQVWKNTYGTSIDLSADDNHDGVVNAADYTIWRDHAAIDIAGESANAAKSVPEPATIVFLMSLLTCVGSAARSVHLTNSAAIAGSMMRRRAFTLVELICVMAIMGTLIAMLLPAVQASRESGRRASCQNNLKQVGTALLNYEGLHRHFPVGAKSSNKTTLGISWWVAIVSFLEHDEILNDFDMTGVHNGWALMHPHNGQLVDGVVIQSLICPSSPLSTLQPTGSFQQMMPSYVGMSGATSHDGFREKRVNTCCVPSNDSEISAGGVLIPNTFVSFSEITDGTSKTLAVSETSDFAINRNGAAMRIDSGYPSGWIAGTAAPGTPPNYLTPYPAGNITTVRHGLNERQYMLPGILQDHGPNNPLISAHPSGVNGLTTDGSASFISNAIDVRVLKMLATRDDGQNAQTSF